MSDGRRRWNNGSDDDDDDNIVPSAAAAANVQQQPRHQRRRRPMFHATHTTTAHGSSSDRDVDSNGSSNDDDDDDESETEPDFEIQSARSTKTASASAASTITLTPLPPPLASFVATAAAAAATAANQQNQKQLLLQQPTTQQQLQLLLAAPAADAAAAPQNTTAAHKSSKAAARLSDVLWSDSDDSFDDLVRALQVTSVIAAATDEDDHDHTDDAMSRGRRIHGNDDNHDEVTLADPWSRQTTYSSDPGNDDSNDDDDENNNSSHCNASTGTTTMPNKGAYSVVFNVDGESSDDDDDNVQLLDDSLEELESAWRSNMTTTATTKAMSTTTRNCYTLVGTQFPDFCIPAALYDRLYEHQKSGVQFLAGLHGSNSTNSRNNNNSRWNGGNGHGTAATAKARGGGGSIGGILGDDMGMGKTFTTLTLLGGLMRAGTIRNALIVAPLSVLASWEKEAQRVLTAALAVADDDDYDDAFVPTTTVRIRILSSERVPAKQRVRLIQDALTSTPRSPYLMITTYGMVRESTLDFCRTTSQHYWDYVVLDEGHTIKNPKAATSAACHRICEHVNKRTHRLLLSGTPIMNHLKELWAVFDWATAGQVLGDQKHFCDTFERTITAARETHASAGMIRAGKAANARLQELLRPYFLQRLKIDYLADLLPPKTELVLWTHLSAKQRRMYGAYIKDNHTVLSIRNGEKASPLEAVTWLKKLCGHPILIEKQGQVIADVLQDMDIEEIVGESAKLELVRDLVAKLIRGGDGDNNYDSGGGHRTLLFSQSTRTLDILEAVLTYDGVRLARIDGSTKEGDRQCIVDAFNSDNDIKYDVLLLSTKAAGVGLTCTGASRVIVYDPSWNPAEDSQAVDRCYRIGQKKEVLVYRMIAAGTVEEKMYEKQVYKDGIRRTVFSKNAADAATSAAAAPIQRYFGRDEHSQLFVLADPGVCTVMEKVKDQHADWSGQSFVLRHRCTVGLSRHDGFYNPTAASTTVADEDDGAAADELSQNAAAAIGTVPLVGRQTVVMKRDTPSAASFVDLVDDSDIIADEELDVSSVVAKQNDVVVLDDDNDGSIAEEELDDDASFFSQQQNDVVVLDDDDSDEDTMLLAIPTTQPDVAGPIVNAIGGVVNKISTRIDDMVLFGSPAAVAAAGKENDNSKNCIRNSNNNNILITGHGAEKSAALAALFLQSHGDSGGSCSGADEIDMKKRSLKQYMDELEEGSAVDDDEQDRVELHCKIAALGRSLGFPLP